MQQYHKKLVDFFFFQLAKTLSEEFNNEGGTLTRSRYRSDAESDTSPIGKRNSKLIKLESSSRSRTDTESDPSKTGNTDSKPTKQESSSKVSTTSTPTTVKQESSFHVLATGISSSNKLDMAKNSTSSKDEMEKSITLLKGEEAKLGESASSNNKGKMDNSNMSASKTKEKLDETLSSSNKSTTENLQEINLTKDLLSTKSNELKNSDNNQESGKVNNGMEENVKSCEVDTNPKPEVIELDVPEINVSKTKMDIKRFFCEHSQVEKGIYKVHPSVAQSKLKRVSRRVFEGLREESEIDFEIKNNELHCEVCVSNLKKSRTKERQESELRMEILEKLNREVQVDENGLGVVKKKKKGRSSSKQPSRKRSRGMSLVQDGDIVVENDEDEQPKPCVWISRKWITKWKVFHSKLENEHVMRNRAAIDGKLHGRNKPKISEFYQKAGFCGSTTTQVIHDTIKRNIQSEVNDTDLENNKVVVVKEEKASFEFEVYFVLSLPLLLLLLFCQLRYPFFVFFFFFFPAFIW